jgi:hypothetical protein
VLVIGGKELLQRALGARIDGVTYRGDVAGGVAEIAGILVGDRVLDVPEFLNAIGLLVLVVVSLLDQRVELQCLLVRLRVWLIRPVF